MNNLSAFSTEDLQQEIERRDQLPPTPRPLDDDMMIWDDVIEAVIEHINTLGSDDEDEDDEHYIYEAAVEAVYGKDIWDWIKKAVS